MTGNILKQIISLLLLKNQYDFDGFDPDFLLRRINKRCEDLDLLIIDDYYHYLCENSQERKVLIEYFIINYTQFYRESLNFCFFEEIIIKELTRQKTKAPIRIWTCGCSSGEEAYTIAMCLESYYKKYQQTPNYQIFASDYDTKVVKNQQNGIYSSNRLDKIPLSWLKDYFDQKGSLFQVKESIQQKVYFSKFDILSKEQNWPERSIYGDFDMVFCMNLLIYYNQSYQNLILSKLTNSIRNNGYLMLGKSESITENGLKLKSICSYLNIYQKK